MLKLIPDTACFAKGSDIFFALVVTVSVIGILFAVGVAIVRDIRLKGGKEVAKGVVLVTVGAGALIALIMATVWLGIYLCTQAYCLYQYLMH